MFPDGVRKEISVSARAVPPRLGHVTTARAPASSKR